MTLANVCSDICPRKLSVPRSEQYSKSEGLAKLGNIVSCYVFVVAKLAGSKQNVLLPRWLNEETLFRKTEVHACA